MFHSDHPTYNHYLNRIIFDAFKVFDTKLRKIDFEVPGTKVGTFRFFHPEKAIGPKNLKLLETIQFFRDKFS